MTVHDLRPRRHAPPNDMPAETFEAVTDGLAAALIAALRRLREAERAVDRPWTPEASLELDRRLVEYERLVEAAREADRA